MKAQQWDELEAAASRWLQWDPDSAAAHLSLAEATAAQGLPSVAADQLDLVPLTDALAPEALAMRVRLLFGPLNRPMEGLAACERLLELKPRHPLAHHYRVNFYAMTLQRVPFLEAARQAIASHAESPEMYAYLMMLDDLSFQDELEIVGAWRAAEPGVPPIEIAWALHAAKAAQRQANKARDARDVEALGDADRRIAELYASEPQDARLLDYLVSRAISDGQVDRCAELLAGVPDSSASDPVFWRYRGWYHVQQQELPEAEAAYRKALQLHPLSWRARHELAGVWRLQQRTQAATGMQALAAQGTAIYDAVRNLHKMRDMDEDLLRQISAYADACEDWPVAAGLHRRLLPKTDKPLSENR